MKQGKAGRRSILLAWTLLLFVLFGCGKTADNADGGSKEKAASTVASGEELWQGFTIENRQVNSYATEFQIDHLSDGYRRITISGQEYLIVPEDKKAPDDLPEEITVIRRPQEKLYVASSSAMSFFQALSTLDAVSYTSTRASDWSEEEIRTAVEEERITYIGKYNAPDYEWLMQEGASLAIENTMLLHSPKTKERLEQLGIPVLIEYSSYEKHPMGRLEWVRVYGCILGIEEEAERYFDAEDQRFRALSDKENGQTDSSENGLKVAYFYFNPNGYVSVQRPGSYVAEMIRLAGGTYFLDSDPGEDSASGSMNLQTDQFYQEAKDADVLIYNGAIYGPPESLEKLTEEYPLLKDFQAVKNGRVYATGDNLFQGVTHMNDVLEELVGILEGKSEGTFFRILP